MSGYLTVGRVTVTVHFHLEVVEGKQETREGGREESELIGELGAREFKKMTCRLCHCGLMWMCVVGKRKSSGGGGWRG